MLNKTLIGQLNNCYIDCSYSKNDNTIIVNIETPNPNGNDVRQPFTIRTKDGYNLKYDDVTGNIVFRINKKYLPSSTGEDEVNSNYGLYFNDYNFNLQTLSTYENVDPVTQFKTPSYPQPDGDNTIAVPEFEYEDIEKQKENIFLIDTGLVSIDYKPVFIASYYGKDPNKCKLELLEEVESDPFGGDPSYIIKTETGRMFGFLIQYVSYGSDPFGGTGKEVTPIVSISANAEQTGEIIEEDNTKGLFSTYVVNQAELNNIANTGAIYSEIIINTFSYPIKFNDDDLLEVNVKLGNTPIEDIKGRKFKRAEPKIKIFTFNVPYLKDVETCKLLLPFNTEITLDYDVIRGKTINGYIQYEVSTNSSTLYIDNEEITFFKDIVVIETVVPYKPTGEYVGFKESQKRLGKQTPVLLIKCLQEEQQHHFIKGFINYQITGILKNELDLLNEELQKGVITNGEIVEPPIPSIPSIPTDGLVCYLDTQGKTNADTDRNTLLDLSGNGNHGTLHNFNFTEESGYVKDLSSGISGLSFDGVDDSLDFVRLTNATPYTYKVNFILTSTAKEQNVLIQFGYGAYVHLATDTLFLPWSNSSVQDTIFLKNKKYEIVTASDGTFDGTDVYINGERKIITRYQSDNFTSITDISSGKKIIENIMLWNRKLTDTEIQLMGV